jgi:hypothetical protein
MRLTGYMISLETWKKYILLSSGSDKMKDRIITYVVLLFNKPRLLDSFELGLAIGEFSNTLSNEEEVDLLKTIKLTRNTDNVPIVQVKGLDS